MARTTRTITFSLPPEMADRVDDLIKRKGGTRSGLIQDALLRYIEEDECRQLPDYGEQMSRQQGLVPEDAGSLVDAYRVETGSAPE